MGDKERRAAYYEKNRDKILAYQKAYREANKDKIKAYKEEHREEHMAKKRVWNKDNKVRLNAYSRDYYWANKDAISKRAKAHREANREKFLARERERRLANPNTKSKNARSNALRRQTTRGPWKYRVDVVTLKKEATLCPYCNKELKSEADKHLDHIVPLRPKKGHQRGFHAPDNVVVCCSSCNMQKSNKTLLEFLLYRQNIGKQGEA